MRLSIAAGWMWRQPWFQWPQGHPEISHRRYPGAKCSRKSFTSWTIIGNDVALVPVCSVAPSISRSAMIMVCASWRRCAVFLVTLFSVMDLGLFFMTKHAVREATSITMRAALLDPMLNGCEAASNHVRGRLTLIDNNKLNICITRNETSEESKIVVTSEYPFKSTTMGIVVSSENISDETETTMPK
ncbi:MAG: hypothetical protein ABIV36_17415 [Sphingobium limneticum]